MSAPGLRVLPGPARIRAAKACETPSARFRKVSAPQMSARRDRGNGRFLQIIGADTSADILEVSALCPHWVSAPAGKADA